MVPQRAGVARTGSRSLCTSRFTVYDAPVAPGRTTDRIQQAFLPRVARSRHGGSPSGRPLRHPATATPARQLDRGSPDTCSGHRCVDGHLLGRRRRHATSAPVSKPGATGDGQRRDHPAGWEYVPADDIDGGHAPLAAGRRGVLGRRGQGQRLPRSNRGGSGAGAHPSQSVHRVLSVDARRHAAPRPGLYTRRHGVRRACCRAPRLRLLAEPLRRTARGDRRDDPAG